MLNRPSRRPGGLFVLIALTGFMTSFGAAYALNGDGGQIEDSGYPGEARVAVASGHDRNYGHWTLYVRTDDQGQQCIGVALPDRNAPYGEGCGGPTDLHIRSVNGEKGTLLIGRVPDDAARATVTSAGNAAKRPSVQRGSKGMKFIVTSDASVLKDVQVDIDRANGAGQAHQRVPTS